MKIHFFAKIMKRMVSLTVIKYENFARQLLLHLDFGNGGAQIDKDKV